MKLKISSFEEEAIGFSVERSRRARGLFYRDNLLAIEKAFADGYLSRKLERIEGASLRQVIEGLVTLRIKSRDELQSLLDEALQSLPRSELGS